MPEGEVSRLYERRQRWEVDREQLLDQTVARNHRLWPPDPAFADLHVVVRPVAATPSLLDDAIPDTDPQLFLLNVLVQARHVFRGSPYHPDLTPQGGWYPRDGGWRAGSSPTEKSRPHILDLTITEQGRGYLFCGRAGARPQQGDPYLVVLEDLIAGLTTRTLFILGSIYKAASYLGPVDVGVAITGISGLPVYSVRVSRLPASGKSRMRHQCTSAPCWRALVRVSRLPASGKSRMRHQCTSAPCWRALVSV